MPLSVTLGEGAEGVLELNFAPGLEDNDEEMERILSNARAFGLLAVGPGEASVTIRWIDHIETFDVTVR